MLKFIQSCAPSNQVVSNWKIQKRKYNSGYQINLRSKFKNSKDENLLQKVEKTSNKILHPFKNDILIEVEDNILSFDEITSNCIDSSIKEHKVDLKSNEFPKEIPLTKKIKKTTTLVLKSSNTRFLNNLENKLLIKSKLIKNEKNIKVFNAFHYINQGLFYLLLALFVFILISPSFPLYFLILIVYLINLIGEIIQNAISKSISVEIQDNKFKRRKTLSQIFLWILILFPIILIILFIYLIINYLIMNH